MFLPLLSDLEQMKTRAEAVTYLDSPRDLLPPIEGMTRNIFCEELWDYPEIPESEQYYFWQFAVECKYFKSHRHPMAFSEGLAKLPVKTFIWGGQFDPVTNIQAMREMHQLIRNSLLWENPYAGHGLIAEKKDCAILLASKFFGGAKDSDIMSVAESSDCQSAPKVGDPSMLRIRAIMEHSRESVGIPFPLF